MIDNNIKKQEILVLVREKSTIKQSLTFFFKYL